MDDTYGLTWKKLHTWMGYGYLLQDSGPLWFGGDGEEGIYCNSEFDLRLINHAPGLFKKSQDILRLQISEVHNIAEYNELNDLCKILDEIRGETP